MHALQMIALKVVVTDVTRSVTHIFRYPVVVNRKDKYGKIPRFGKSSRRFLRLTSPVLIGCGTTVSPTRICSKEISSTSVPIIPVKVKNAQPFHTSINGHSSKNRDPTPTFSKVIRRKLSNKSSANIYSCCWVNFTRDAVLTKIPKSTNLGISAVHTLNELGSFSIPDTIIERPTDGSNQLSPENIIGEATASRMSRTRSEKNHSFKTDFETRRGNQDFEQQKNSMSRPPLDSIPFGNNKKTTPIDSIPVRTKTPDLTPRTRPTDSPTLTRDSSEQKREAHIRGDPDP